MGGFISFVKKFPLYQQLYQIFVTKLDECFVNLMRHDGGAGKWWCSECSGSRTFEWVLDNFEKSAKMMRVDWVDGYVKG